MGNGVEEFTSSTNGGQTWSTPVVVGPDNGTMSLDEWWIDGTLAVDSAGNLYASWDTQAGGATASPMGMRQCGPAALG